MGDIESLPYIEAVRQLRWELGPQNCIVIHLTLVPFLHASGELKTKPTQHSVKQLLENLIIGRKLNLAEQPKLLHPKGEGIAQRFSRKGGCNG